jgi:glutathione S-transferase
MAITMYDLAGIEADRRFSPFCWRAKMALAHKGLASETVPWRFTEKDKLPTPNAGRVPVIIDDGKVIHDSSAIADYLEERYADRPSLFPGEAARGLSKFVQNWTDTVLQVGLIRLVLLDIYNHIGPEDQVYFRQSREERFGGATLKRSSRTAKHGCPRFGRASTRCGAPSAASPLCAAPRRLMPTTSYSARSNGRARSAISSW